MISWRPLLLFSDDLFTQFADLQFLSWNQFKYELRPQICCSLEWWIKANPNNNLRIFCIFQPLYVFFIFLHISSTRSAFVTRLNKMGIIQQSCICFWQKLIVYTLPYFLPFSPRITPKWHSFEIFLDDSKIATWNFANLCSSHNYFLYYF